ncbi:hypothetical protein ACFL5R_02280, partial [Pseudomonadota bacterium]
KHGVVLFDPYGTFTKLGRRKVEQVTSLEHFYRRLAFLQHRNKPFALSLKGFKDTQTYDLFCRIIWEVADGGKILEIVCDEMKRYLPSPTVLNDGLTEILQGGRKYGLIFHGIFHRPQTIPKDLVRGCKRKWIGLQDSMADARYWADEIDIDAREIAALDELEYFFKSGAIGSTVRGKLKPLKR